MADLKTRPTGMDVKAFLRSISDDARREDGLRVLELMQEITGEEPRMWGPAMIGFGSYQYRYETGHEGEYFIAGFSPRKANLALYIMAGLHRYPELLARLGKHRTGKSCLYIKRMSDVEEDVLRELVSASVAHMRANYRTGQRQDPV
jgi:hypothetical protein